MRVLWASFYKDLLLLCRDRAGLAILFVMPMALVLVVSLVQNNILEATGQKAFKVLFVDAGGSDVGQQLRHRLETDGGIELIATLDGQPLTASEAKKRVARGDYQFAIILPFDLETKLKKAMTVQEGGVFGGQQIQKSERLGVEICFDPTVQGVFRTAVLASLRYALLGITFQKQGEVLSAMLAAQGVTVSRPLMTAPLLQVAEVPAGQKKWRPNAVQQNVPAWSLFGIFFIVVPLGGALLRERQQGTLKRLRSLPVSGWSVLTGKLLAYTSICLVQFGLMLLVGRFLLPRLGTPVFHIGEHPGAVFLMGLVSALAATGYGLFIGCVARSYEQASMLGAISIVIAAAIGGIMVPVYVMPPEMQWLSQFSPLGWGLNGFLKLFVSGGGVTSILPQIMAMLLFFCVTLAMSLMIFKHRSQNGR